MKNVYTLLDDAKAILDDLNIPYGTIYRVTINSRAQSRWGRCTYNARYDNYTIEISSRLLTDDVTYEAAMDTMIHEVLHAYRTHMSHTGEWKRCAELINKEYPQYNIKRCTSNKEKGIEPSISTYKYKVVCNYCGTVNYYRKETKIVRMLKHYPNYCKCTVCKGHSFKVEEVR